mgnify:CR=1 FL=1
MYKRQGLGGYDTDTAVNKVSNGLSIDGDMRQRLFDQLSGGEKTRVNLGRLILEDTDILLLDEPTAALDPVAEAEIYAKFNEIAGDKTAIYISHRLSSCKFCDEIAVFDHGEVVQQGTHEELLGEPDGKYYELWNAQAQYYTEESA